MKDLARKSFCAVYKYSGLMFAHESALAWAARSFASIVLFHRVTDEIPHDGITVDTAWFRGFCKLMRKFNVVPLDEVIRSLHENRRLSSRTVAITFDDCYRDNLFAARTLAEHGLPATFFVPPAYVGTDHTFTWDVGLKKLANLSWDDVREMTQLGHDVGSHTLTHPNLAELDEEGTRHELTESRRILEDRLERRVRHFAYPFGGREHFLPRQLEAVFEAGYECCLAAQGGVVVSGMRPNGQVLPRVAMPGFRDLLHLELHLTGCLDWVYAARGGSRGNAALIPGLGEY